MDFDKKKLGNYLGAGIGANVAQMIMPNYFPYNLIGGAIVGNHIGAVLAETMGQGQTQQNPTDATTLLMNSINDMDITQLGLLAGGIWYFSPQMTTMPTTVLGIAGIDFVAEKAAGMIMSTTDKD